MDIEFVDVEVVDDLQPLPERGGQRVELGAEDHRVAITVGIEEPDPAVGPVQRRLEEREHRGDAASGGERDQLALVRPEQEYPCRHRDLELASRLDVVQQPVRHGATGHAFDGHLELAVDGRGRRHRVAPEQGLVVDLDAERAELTGLVGEGLGELGRDVEDDRAGIRGLGDDASHVHAVEPVIMGRGANRAADRGARASDRHGADDKAILRIRQLHIPWLSPLCLRPILPKSGTIPPGGDGDSRRQWVGPVAAS